MGIYLDDLVEKKHNVHNINPVNTLKETENKKLINKYWWVCFGSQQEARNMSGILRGNVLYTIEICKSLSGKKLKRPLANCMSSFERQIAIGTELLKELTIPHKRQENCCSRHP